MSPQSEQAALLAEQAAKLVRDTDDPQRLLRNAQGAAEEIERRLRNSQAGLVDVREGLNVER
jgi:hypothetical protein